jgi:hypothetical protein
MALGASESDVRAMVLAGSEPSILSPTPDGSEVYAFLSGEWNMARVKLAVRSRDLVFAADPTGNSIQYNVFDLAVGPDGGLAISYPGGTIAIFDNGRLRPQIDPNSEGPFPNDPATFNLAFKDSGWLLYAYNSFLSTLELKRDAVSAKGLRWLSSKTGLVTGYYTKIKFAKGLIYTSYGDVIDPERSVIAGHFTDDWFTERFGQDVAPDVVQGRVYFVTMFGILVFDIKTHAVLARFPLNVAPDFQNYPTRLVRFGADGLACITSSGQLYLVSISAIMQAAK